MSGGQLHFLSFACHEYAEPLLGLCLNSLQREETCALCHHPRCSHLWVLLGPLGYQEPLTLKSPPSNDTLFAYACGTCSPLLSASR